MIFVVERAVRFEEVDAAGILFFARYLGFCHDAMERFFDGVDGGYVDLITRRKIGFPAVHVEGDFKAPLRYGDVAKIDVTVKRIGETSATLRYAMRRMRDGADAATIEHVVVATDLASMTKLRIPDDVRTLLTAYIQG
jgi:4-hydroxybenzoyl-CoA thioesterase